MTSLELCRQERAKELARFVKVLRAVPGSRPDYRPDPKSRTATEIAWLLAQSEASLLKLIETGEIQWSESKPDATLDAIVASFERSANAVNEKIGKLDEGAWDKKVRFVMEGAPPWEDTLGAFVWGFLFDSIHHRGQLTTYLRPMGGKVPAVYGPSADDSGQ